MIKNLLEETGFKDVQRGLKIYKTGIKKELIDKPTSKTFTDIDIIAHNKKKNKIIICELKNWHYAVKHEKIETWVTEKLNPIVDYLRLKLGIDKDIEAWYIVSLKSDDIDENKIKNKCKCEIKILNKIELINDIIQKENMFIAEELRSIIIY